MRRTIVARVALQHNRGRTAQPRQLSIADRYNPWPGASQQTRLALQLNLLKRGRIAFDGQRQQLYQNFVPSWKQIDTTNAIWRRADGTMMIQPRGRGYNADRVPAVVGSFADFCETHRWICSCVFVAPISLGRAFGERQTPAWLA